MYFQLLILILNFDHFSCVKLVEDIIDYAIYWSCPPVELLFGERTIPALHKVHYTSKLPLEY